MTIGDFKRHLSVFKDDDELIFGEPRLSFYRTKLRGDKLVQIEFEEMYQLESTEEYKPN